MIEEKRINVASGYLWLVLLFVFQIASIVGLILAATFKLVLFGILSVLFGLIILICWIGFFMVHPNEAKVMQLFGRYVGTAREPGLRWANPFYAKKPVSVRVRNFESNKIKVNERSGSPIEIASVVVWRVVDTAEAIFEVDDFEEFVNIQTEAALRNMATSFLYESEDPEEISLRSHPVKIAESLKVEIQDRLHKAGVEVIEARISHLAYAPEIASAMLRRQQANAIIAARSKIVEGAVGMVEMALNELDQKQVVQLDEERKAQMVSNLLVVLCSEENTQPVLNAGSLYG
jgi:regulator of protease activity HflC (stomatin/prohibitin superfamily)